MQPIRGRLSAAIYVALLAALIGALATTVSAEAPAPGPSPGWSAQEYDSLKADKMCPPENLSSNPKELYQRGKAPYPAQYLEYGQKGGYYVKNLWRKPCSSDFVKGYCTKPNFCDAKEPGSKCFANGVWGKCAALGQSSSGGGDTPPSGGQPAATGGAPSIPSLPPSSSSNLQPGEPKADKPTYEQQLADVNSKLDTCTAQTCSNSEFNSLIRERTAFEEIVAIEKSYALDAAIKQSDAADREEGLAIKQGLENRINNLADTVALDPNAGTKEMQELRQLTALNYDYFGAQRGFSDPNNESAFVGTVKSIGEVSIATTQGNTYAYDGDGNLFASAANNDYPTLYDSAGRQFPTSAIGGEWTGEMKNVVQTPEQWTAFRDMYMGTPASVRGGSDSGGEDVTVKGFLGQDMLLSRNQDVIVKDTLGNERILSREAYDAVNNLGRELYGVNALRDQIAAQTGGLVSVPRENLLPQELAKNNFIGSEGQINSQTPSYALTQITPEREAQVLNLVSRELDKYPSEFWDGARTTTRDIPLYTFASNKEMGAFQAAGNTYQGGGRLLLNTSQPDWYTAETVHHELAHDFDSSEWTRSQGIFPSDTQFAQSVYGDVWQKAYLGTSGQQAIAEGKLGGVTPEGFADPYGQRGGVAEDKATIAEGLFKNYPAMVEAARVDPVLAQKMSIIQQGYYDASGGKMNSAYWNSLTPMNPQWQVRPSFVQTVVSRLRASK